MSARERCLSSDRPNRREQNICLSRGYIPERSPNRSPARTCSAPSTPDILRDSFHGVLPAQSFDEVEACPTPRRFSNSFELPNELESQQHQRTHRSPDFPHLNDLPDEYLEDLTQPTFHEPEHTSFDELMCILATPPSRRHVLSAKSSSTQRSPAEVSECVGPQSPRVSSRRGPTPKAPGLRAETKIGPQFCPYKMSPLPDDPYDIPPHPKDPNDVVGFIRRSRAIHRLKAIQEEAARKQKIVEAIGMKQQKLQQEAAKTQLMGTTRQGVGVVEQSTLCVSKQPGLTVKPQAKRSVRPPQPKGAFPPLNPRKSLPLRQTQKANVLGQKKLKAPVVIARPTGLRPPQFVGLNTNFNVLPKFKTGTTPQRPQGVAVPLSTTSVQSQLQPRSDQFASFAARAAAFRAAAANKTVQPIQKEQRVECPARVINAQSESFRSPCYPETSTRDAEISLAEFEDLERQIAAECASPPQVVSQNVSLEEFEELERQLCQTDEEHRDELEACERQIQANAIERIDDIRTSPFGTNDSLEEFETLERQCNAQTDNTDEFQALEEQLESMNLRNRIESLKAKLLASAEIEPDYGDMANARAIMQERQVPQASKPSPEFGLPPVIRYFELVKQMKAKTTAEHQAELDDEECEMSELPVDPNQFADVADWKLAELSSEVDDQSFLQPIKMKAPTTSANISLSPLSPTLLDDIDMSDLYFEDISMQSFPTEEVYIDQQIGLVDRTAENRFEQNISCNETGIENVTYPDLDDLSMSTDIDHSPQIKDCKDLESSHDQQTSPGFLTSVVNAVMDKFRHMFGGTPKDVEEIDDEQNQCINLESSLPNMFEETPPPTLSEEAFTTPEYPEEYIAMIKKSQQIHKQKQKEAEKAAVAAAKAARAQKPIVKSTIPKRAPRPLPRGKPPRQKKPLKNVYPPEEYSPRCLAEIARARTLAGYKNRSALLNPQRAARIAAKEAELAAEEALPPVERMRKRIARLERQGKRIRPKPSIETLGTLEGIRANLPRPKIFTAKSKWTPATRRSVDRCMERDQRVFNKTPTRIFKEFTPLTPLTEESYNEKDLIRFSPLRARECRLRLQRLQEEAQQHARRTDARAEEDVCLPETTSVRYSPIRLHSPSRSQTEDTVEDGERVGEKSITEEITKTSTIENGEVHTTTRKVTTKTDEFGNVSCHVEEDTGLTGESETVVDDIDATEAPEFLLLSDTEPPRDPSIPTPSEIIDRIRMQVQQKLDMVLPNLSSVPERTSCPAYTHIEFPDDLPDEQLHEVEMPELDTTPLQQVSGAYRSPDISLPLVFEEESVEQIPVCSAASRVEASIAQKSDSAVKTKSTNQLPPLPTNPKDYVGMVKYARALDKFKRQQSAKCPPMPPQLVVKKLATKPVRKTKMPVAPVRKPTGKQRPSKTAPKKIGSACELVEETSPTPPQPPPEYLAEIARARTLAGYKNRTPALNPQVAAELAEYQALSDYQKILRRMEKVRKLPAQSRKTTASTDMIATFEGIKSSKPPTEPDQVCVTEEELEKSKLVMEDQCAQEQSLEAVERSRNISLDEFEKLERQLCETEQLDESTHSMSIERQLKTEAQNQSLAEYEALEREMCDMPGSTVPNLATEVATSEKPISPAEAFCIRNRIQTLTDQLLNNPDPMQQFSMQKRIKELQRKLVGADDPEYYRELIQDFRPARSEYGEIVIGDLEPVDPRERLRRIKERQQQSRAVPEICEMEESIPSTSIGYSPVQLFSPTAEHTPVKTPEKFLDEPAKQAVLIDLDSPKIPYRVKQFKDLEDMPFDDLAFEDAPSFANDSYESPMSPPPKPAELISKIRRQVQERLRIEKQNQMTSMSAFQFPNELPEEDLFDLSSISLAHTTIGDTPKNVSPRSKSPARTLTPQSATQQEPVVIQCPKPSEDLYRPKVPQAWVDQVMKARAIYKQKQAEIDIAPPRQPAVKKGRMPIPKKTVPKKPTSKKSVARVVVRKGFGRPSVVTRRKYFSPQIDARLEVCPPPLPPPSYLEEIARARTMAGLKNRTAALNPDIAAFEALPEYEKIKIRMDRARQKQGRKRWAKPTSEQIAFLEAMKLNEDYQPAIRPSAPAAARSPSPSPCRIKDPEISELSEFEALEFEALEQELASPVTRPRHISVARPIFDEAHEQIKKRAEAQLRQLATPPQLDARERYKRLICQASDTPKVPVPPTPIKTPEIHYSPVVLQASPSTPNRPQQFESRLLITDDDLAGIEEPSFLDTTPASPTCVPRPRDIIERVRRDVESRPKPPFVPTGQLIDLRTPPRELPLPQDITHEELLGISCPALTNSPPKSPCQPPASFSVGTLDVSLPEVFAETPDPPLPPVSPLRYRVHSPPGPIIIPPYPEDPNDYRAMCRMSRKIYELKLQQEAEAKAATEAAAAAAAIDAAKPKKNERIPISRWVKPPQKAPTKRKKLVMKKPCVKTVAQQTIPLAPPELSPECPSEPSEMPAEYIAEINRARQLAGIRNIQRKLEFPPELSGPADYKKLMAKMDIIRKHGQVEKAQPSLQAEAYLNALKNAMSFQPSTEPAEIRYKRILEARAVSSRPSHEKICEEEIQYPEDVHYSPVTLGSPSTKHREDIGFDMAEFDEGVDLEEIPEPSFFAESPSPSVRTRHFHDPLATSPPPTPSAIIRRMRAQVHEKLATEKLACPMLEESPGPLNFPEDLSYEDLMELSAPCFASTPESRTSSPVYSPNVSIPQYFEEPTPPPPMGIIPGLSVLTPESPFELSPSSNGKESDIEMVRRAQLIHKIKTKQEADKMAAETAAEEAVKEAAKAKAKVRVPISRRIGGPTITRPNKGSVGLGKPKVVPKKQMEPQEPNECPSEPPELPAEYIAEIARARRLAGLKNTRPELNPPQTYDTISARFALLRAGHGETEPTVQEMIEADNAIRRRKCRESPQQHTTRPHLERFLAQRSRFKENTTPTTSRVPCSPLTTPVLSEYQPICLRPTPPFLQNINLSDLGDVSIPNLDSMADIYEDNLGDISQYSALQCSETASQRMDRRR